MGGCDRLRDLIALYASGDLNDEDRARVEAHLEGCAKCRRDLAAMRGLVELVSSERVTPPDDLAARITEHVRRGVVTPVAPRSSVRWSVALGIASVAVVVFAAGIVVGFQLPGSMVQQYVARLEGPPPGNVQSRLNRFAATPSSAQPPQQNNASTASPSSTEASSTGALEGSQQPTRLKAPLPATTDSVQLAMLPPEPVSEPTGAGPGAGGEATPSRGDIRSGVIRGRVTYNDRGMPFIHLRLVDADGSFVAGVAATTDADGQYEFRNIPYGMYRVYVYTGDNPLYFNRTSRLARMRRGVATVGDVELAMALQPLELKPDEEVAMGADATFRWSACPGASEYAFTITDQATAEEVYTATVKEPKATVPPGEFTPDHTYRWHVTCTADDGSMLGASPGAGGELWTFRVR